MCENQVNFQILTSPHHIFPPQTLQVPTIMSTFSYVFEGPDPDVILRAPLQPGSDEFKDFHVHKLILSIASITFRDTFSIPQPPRHTSDDDTVDIVHVSELANVIETFLQLIYPVDPPLIEDLWLVGDLFRAADKYAAKGITAKLKKFLVSPSFLKDDPIGVFAIACSNNLDEEAGLAVQHTFTIDVVNQISEERLNTMTAKTYHRLLTEHALRRKRLIDALNTSWRSLDPHSRCSCMAKLEEKVQIRICGRPFLDRETLELCLSLVEGSGCGGGGRFGTCMKQYGGSSVFLSDAISKIHAL